MGTITERYRKNGSVAYLAQIAIMRDRKLLHRESQTFDRKPAANAWIKKRESELAKPGAILGQHIDKRNPTLAEAIDRYITESKRDLGKTKKQVLASIKKYDIADMACADVKSTDIVELANTLGKQMKPQTVGNYLSHLSAVFSITKAAWGYDLNPQVMADAFKVAKRLGVTAKSGKRERRPTLEELNALMEHYSDRKTRRSEMMPMQAIIAFAIFSTRRQEEITRITWKDLEFDAKRVLVRDMKNPGEKMGNDVWCDLPEPALRVIMTMPKGATEIFPYNCRSISASFTRACKVLGIADLHFHDLRHEGVTRLFELGLNIPHVAAVSGHRSWASLNRYTHLRQTGDKFSNWRWLDEMAQIKEKSSNS